MVSVSDCIECLMMRLLTPYPLLHISNDLLGFTDLLSRDLVVLGVVQRRELDLLILELGFGACYGCREFLDGLIT